MLAKRRRDLILPRRLYSWDLLLSLGRPDVA